MAFNNNKKGNSALLTKKNYSNIVPDSQLKMCHTFGMNIVVTICSKHKDNSPKLLPASKRYISEHIRKAEVIAKDLQLPFFILSGKYGLLATDEMIPNYDQYLEIEAVDSLVKVVEAQLKTLHVTEVDYYMEDKESWIPYDMTLKKATDLAGVFLRVHQL